MVTGDESPKLVSGGSRRCLHMRLRDVMVLPDVRQGLRSRLEHSRTSIGGEPAVAGCDFKIVCIV